MESARLWLIGGMLSLLLASCCKTTSHEDIKCQPKVALPTKANYPTQPARGEHLYFQASKEGQCPADDLVCPQRRSYLVTYDSCCDFPITYKKK